MLLLLIEKNLKLLASIISSLGGIFWAILNLKKWFMKTRIKYGVIDIPYANEIHYYIEIYPCFIKKFFRFCNKRKIKVELIFHPKHFQISDYEVIIREFIEFIGHEHLQKNSFIEKIEHKTKILSFELDSSKIYRMIIKSKCGLVGSTVQCLYDLEIKSNDAKVMYKK